jgi:hypothetical protein
MLLRGCRWQIAQEITDSRVKRVFYAMLLFLLLQEILNGLGLWPFRKGQLLRLIRLYCHGTHQSEGLSSNS